MALKERHITGVEQLDNYVTFSHWGEVSERADTVSREEIEKVLDNAHFLNLINHQIAQKRPLAWGYLPEEYSAFIGINLARIMHIPCIEYDEQIQDEQTLKANKQYVLLRWTKGNENQQEKFREIQAIVHT